MRKSRYSEEQIVGMLREHEAGVSIADLCRCHGISQQTIYRWKQQYGGMQTSELRRLKHLEAENARLKNDSSASPAQACATNGGEMMPSSSSGRASAIVGCMPCCDARDRW